MLTGRYGCTNTRSVFCVIESDPPARPFVSAGRGNGHRFDSLSLVSEYVDESFSNALWEVRVFLWKTCVSVGRWYAEGNAR